MPWQLSGQAAGLRLRSVRPARPTPPKELSGVPPRAGEPVPVGTKTCRLIFLFTTTALRLVLTACAWATSWTKGDRCFRA